MSMPLPGGGLSLLLILPVAVVIVALVTGFVIPVRTPTWRKRRILRATLGVAAEPKALHSPAIATVRRMPIGSVLGKMGRKLNECLPRGEALQTHLEQAGIQIGTVDLAIIFLFLLTSISSVFYFWFHLTLIISICLGFIIMTFVPALLIAGRARTRRRRFLSQFPDAVDLIVRGVRSGLPVTEALHAVGREVHGQVGAIFQDISGNIRLGKSLNEALSYSTQKLDVQEMRFFSISLAIQQETGGNLGEILQNLSTLMRRREQLKLKIKAMSSEARASAMIIGSLPFIMFAVIYALDHDYVAKLFLDTRGWLLIGAGLSSLTVGLAVMAKMVRFEI